MGIDRLKISSERLRRCGVARIVLLEEGGQRPTEAAAGEAVGAVMAGNAVGLEQLRARLTPIQVLRPSKPARQRHDDNGKRTQSAPER
jgi:hypothetical protein